MIRTLFIETLGDGGIAHYTYNLVKAIHEFGVNVTLITTYRYELKKEKVPVNIYYILFKFAFAVIERFPKLSKETIIPTFLRRIMKIIEYPINAIQCLSIARKEKVQIVHLQSVHLIELIMIILFKIFGYQIIYTIHNVMPGHKKLNPIQRGLYSLLYSCCNYLIIHSEISRQDVIKLYWVNPHRISVIPHGDYRFFVPETPLSEEKAKEKLGLSRKRKTILFFGAIRSNKGLEDILAALPRIIKSIPKVVLLIVGEAFQDYRKYRKLISSLGIRGYVYEYLRYIPIKEVSTFFYASDLVVLPYREISQSGVLQVAYAFGKPVVATSLGGFQEAVEDGKNGFLVAPRNTDMLAEKVIEIIGDNEKTARMGDYSSYLSNTKYSWAPIAKKTVRIYYKIINPGIL